jgi:AcrR family transcriptional regulator
LPPDERRAAIIDAALPLLLEHGSGVTTKQLAGAAGIAEGTIFRVFADKNELIDAVVDTVFDTGPAVQALRQIDLALSLDERLARAVEIMQRRVAAIWQLMTAVGLATPPERHKAAKAANVPDMAALIEVLAPDADALRRTPQQAARYLRSLTFACSHPALVADDPLSPPEIVELFLDGLRT